MAAFREVRDLLAFACFEDIIDEDKFLLLWELNDVATSWKFIDFKKNLKIGLSSVGRMYLVCAILRNALTCLYGNMTSEYFDLDPPTLQDYFI